MSAQCESKNAPSVAHGPRLDPIGETTGARAAGAPLGFFERYLTLWVFLCIVAGIGLGHLFPTAFQAIGRMEVARVNLPVAALIWLMIVPMLLKVDFGALHAVRRHWKGIGVTLFINWGVKPFSMALLAWLFIRHAFTGWLPAEQLDSYVAGLILLSATPCTAMVFVWSRLTGGEAEFHAHPGGAQRHDHGVRVRADRGPAARPVRDYRAVGHAAAVGRAVHRHSGDRRASLARATAHARRGSGAGAHADASAWAVTRRAARDTRLVIRLC